MNLRTLVLGFKVNLLFHSEESRNRFAVEAPGRDHGPNVAAKRGNARLKDITASR